MLAISDKIDHAIFEIRIEHENAKITSAIEIPDIPERSTHYVFPANIIFHIDELLHPGKMDWEAIACYGSSIYLLSERYDAILQIQSGHSEWLHTDWYSPLHSRGYLGKYNAFVEGLIALSPEHFLIALEREPREILDLTKKQPSTWTYAIKTLANDGDLDFHGRPEDAADLAQYHNQAFVLERNAAAVCRRDIKNWKIIDCFSFQSIEENAEYQYADRRFGLAEGLAIDDQWVYIVYDNNQEPRVKFANDNRVLFLRIPLPRQWH